jgi:hypothetical protein
MPEEKASLEDLERILSQRLEEVQRLQRDIEQRKAQVQFDELTALRQRLEEQLREVNDKIVRIKLITETTTVAQSPSSMTASMEPAVVTESASTTAVSEALSAPIPEQPVVASVESMAATTTAKPKRRQSTVKIRRVEADASLDNLLRNIVEDHQGRPVTIDEMTTQVKRRGYRTTTPNLPLLIKIRVGHLIRNGKLASHTGSQESNLVGTQVQEGESRTRSRRGFSSQLDV